MFEYKGGKDKGSLLDFLKTQISSEETGEHGIASDSDRVLSSDASDEMDREEKDYRAPAASASSEGASNRPADQIGEAKEYEQLADSYFSLSTLSTLFWSFFSACAELLWMIFCEVMTLILNIIGMFFHIFFTGMENYIWPTITNIVWALSPFAPPSELPERLVEGETMAFIRNMWFWTAIVGTGAYHIIDRNCYFTMLDGTEGRYKRLDEKRNE